MPGITCEVDYTLEQPVKRDLQAGDFYNASIQILIRHIQTGGETTGVKGNHKFPKPSRSFTGILNSDSFCHDGFSVLIIDKDTIILGYPI